MGIELKTKSGKTLQTLFSRVPSRYTKAKDKRSLFEQYCYFDSRRNRRALYASFSSRPDRLGFGLRVRGQSVQVVHNGETILEYDAEYLEEALLSKHSQTAFLAVSRRLINGKEHCLLDGATYCKWPSIIRFLRLVSAGDVYLDFTMAEQATGRVADHGFLWRVETDCVDRLYLSTEVLELDHPNAQT